jgi:hypothetical protein
VSSRPCEAASGGGVAGGPWSWPPWGGDRVGGSSPEPTRGTRSTVMLARAKFAQSGSQSEGGTTEDTRHNGHRMPGITHWGPRCRGRHVQEIPPTGRDGEHLASAKLSRVNPLSRSRVICSFESTSRDAAVWGSLYARLVAEDYFLSLDGRSHKQKLLLGFTLAVMTHAGRPVAAWNPCLFAQIHLSTGSLPTNLPAYQVPTISHSSAWVHHMP